MKFDIISIFPEFFEGPLSCGMLRVARQRGIISTQVTNPRTFAPAGIMDDYQFGGGAGMVFKPEPLAKAINSVQTKKSLLIHLTPKGERLDQTIVNELAGHEHIVLLCGRYKGVDERINDIFQPREISVGDYILSGGEAGALILIESITRLLPNVLGNRDSADSDSFQDNILEAPIYTRPNVFKKHRVPQILRSGNHNAVAKWRSKRSLEITLARRPELLAEHKFSKKDIETLLEVLNG